jgi:RHS repeat-associated protein
MPKWVHADPVVKSQRITNYYGVLEAVVEVDPWGGETARSWQQWQQPHRYATYERDGNGNDQAMYRQYHSYWQRFDQPDPYDGSYNLTDPQSLNRYAYVQNDPVNFVDPNGLNAVESTCHLIISGNYVRDGEGYFITMLGWELRCYGGNSGSGGGTVDGGGGQRRPPPAPTPQPCDPGFFDASDAPNYRGFSGNDLNTVARVVYAEAASVAAGGTDEEGDAIVSVIYNRLQQPRYFNRPPNQTLSDVVYGARRNRRGQIIDGVQFESVTGHGGGGNNKWRNTAGNGYRSLNEAECNELRRGVNAVRRLLERGSSSHAFTEFRAAGRNPPAGWTVLGGNKFR